MDIQKLIEKRANLWANAKNYLDTHTDENGQISAEDAATYEKMEGDIVALGKQIERFRRRDSMENYLSGSDDKPLLSDLGGSADNKKGRASNEYKAAMIQALRDNFKVVRNVLQEGVAASGGYLVPAEWDSRLIDKLSEENVVRSLATVITTSGAHNINIVASKPAATWVAEGGALTFGDATFAQKTLNAHKLHVAIKVTNELLTDNAFNLENYIIDHFGKALGNAEEDAFLTGNGSGKPTGIFTTAALVANSPLETAGASVAGNDIIDLVHALERPYRRNAAFIMNDSSLALIRKLKDQNQAYLWQPSYQAGEPDRLFGYPVYTSAYAPAATSGTAFIVFGDFSYYNIADRGVRAVQELKELFAGNDQTGFVMKERVDGVLTRDEAVKALKLK